MFRLPAAAPHGVVRLCWSALWLCLLPGTLVDAAPTVGPASLRGLTIGGSTTVVIEGSELGPQSRLLLPWPQATSTLLPDATPQRCAFQITLPGEVAPGIYDLRVANESGVSNAVPVGVDRLPQLPWTPQIETLPVALHGQLAGEQRLRTAFTGRKGQVVTVDVECQRLGGAVRPVVRIYDARGVQWAWRAPQLEFSGDTHLVVPPLPADGVYTIEVHDVLYRAAAPGFVRLKVGELAFGEQLLPTGVTLGATASLEWIGGHLPAGTRTDFTATGTVPGERPAVPPPGLLFTGHVPRVFVSDMPEVLEGAAPAAGPASPLGRPPLAISGRLAARGEEDRLVIDVVPGSRLQFDVVARRLGSPLDGVLTILGPQGNGLASGDDRPGTPDPGLDFTVPEKVERLTLVLRDLQGRGGADFVYRLVVRDLQRPTVSATFDADRLNIPAGGTVLLPVQVTRQAYDGPLQVVVEGLPGGVQLQGASLAPGATQGLLSLSAPASGPAAVGVGRVIVQGSDGPTAFQRVALLPEAPTRRMRPWSREDLAVAVTAPGALAVEWAGERPDEPLPLGWKLPRSLVVRRGPNAAGSVRFRLVTSQPMPKRTVKRNNMDVQEDDLERALRLDDAPPLAADQGEATVQLRVPADLTAGPWSVAVVAELLGADNKTVTASAATPVRVLATRTQLALEVTSPAQLPGKVGDGEAGKVQGRVVRAAGWDTPVTVTLVGLPEGVKAPSVVVPPGQVEFALPLNFPAGTKPGELKGVRIQATAPFDVQQPQDVVRSNEVGLTVNLQAALPAPRAVELLGAAGSLWNELLPALVALRSGGWSWALAGQVSVHEFPTQPKVRQAGPAVAPIVLPPQGHRPDKAGSVVQESSYHVEHRALSPQRGNSRLSAQWVRHPVVYEYVPQPVGVVPVEVVRERTRVREVQRAGVDSIDYRAKTVSRPQRSAYRAPQPAVIMVGPPVPVPASYVYPASPPHYSRYSKQRSAYGGHPSRVIVPTTR
ncbi:MAG: hypothetical protein U0935_25315 [Pirellulales bacterium]